jgi:general secretion pathway protein F
MIKAGEESGNLIVILEELYHYQSEISETKKFVISTLIYPAILFITSILSALILIIFVIPKFGQIFEDLQQTPPLIMQFLLFTGEFIKKYWITIFTLIGTSVFLFLYFNKKYDYISKINKYLIKIPLVGTILTKFDYYRLFNTLSILLEGGVPIINSLILCEKVIFLENLKESVKLFYRKLKQGKKLSSLMKETGEFPIDIVSIVSIGEETGNLPESLKHISINANKTVRELLKKYLSILEPLTIILMGVFIGGIILSMLSGIFSINETV